MAPKSNVATNRHIRMSLSIVLEYDRIKLRLFIDFVSNDTKSVTVQL